MDKLIKDMEKTEATCIIVMAACKREFERSKKNLKEIRQLLKRVRH